MILTGWGGESCSLKHTRVKEGPISWGKYSTLPPQTAWQLLSVMEGDGRLEPAG